jgi:hypothetical protein
LIGIGRETLDWTNHIHFIVARNPTIDLSKIIVENVFVRFRDCGAVVLNFKSIDFKLNEKMCGSVFLDILVKEMILEWF